MASAEETLAGEKIVDSEEGNCTDKNLQGNGDFSKEVIYSTPEKEASKETLELATKLFEEGSKAIEDGDCVDAVDLLSRALEIRVAHYGELATECAISYYKYGCALLFKSQEEADPLVNVPKSTPETSEKDKCHVEGSGSSKASVRCATEGNLSCDNEEVEEGANDKDQEDDDEHSDDGDESAEADEDDSDLDLAWKMLDVARAIVEKSPEDTILKVNILSSLGEVSMEREDFETSLNDYLKALSILERLVEPDNRCIVELNFRICLVLEVGGKTEEAIPFCQKAISLCKSRLKRLSEDVNLVSLPVDNATPPTNSEEGSNSNALGEAGADLRSPDEDEKVVIGGVLSELEKKLEDLQLVSNPRSAISEFMKMVASKSSPTEMNLSNAGSTLCSSRLGGGDGGFDSPTISTAATNGGITHLGVVGRGVKRASLNPVGVKPPTKKLSVDSGSCLPEAVDSAHQES